MIKTIFRAAFAVALLLAGCAPAAPASPMASANGAPKVVAVETFLADIAQNVAGERLQVSALIPIGLDPHEFEPTPQDVVKISQSQVLIVNGAGFEGWLNRVLDNAGGQRTVIEATHGLTMRTPQPGEVQDAHGEGDPHFWLDPNNVIQYVENIRDGLAQADPQGKAVYEQNAAAYITQLKDLDAWIRDQVAQIPAGRRLLVTNHESLGYFADRYGFTIVGSIIPSVSSSASPSAQQMADLVNKIKQSGAPAIFLETGTNPQLADQVAAETGAKVVTGLFTHSVTAADGAAPTYLAMIRFNVSAIVDALK